MVAFNIEYCNNFDTEKMYFHNNFIKYISKISFDINLSTHEIITM